jgi:uncharacterized membrane protein YfcA
VVLGVLAGANVGARLLLWLHARALRIVFGLVIVVLGLQMLYRGVAGFVELYRRLGGA